MAYLDYLCENEISFIDRLRLFFKFGIIGTAKIYSEQKRSALFYHLQNQYYEKAILEKRSSLKKHQEVLDRNNFEKLLKKATEASMIQLKNSLNKKSYPKHEFNIDNYKGLFADFIERYPIIGSSSFSIINSVDSNTLLDYVIVDEASQQDIIPGILGLACAKNVVIVGDRKQLPHIPTLSETYPPDEAYDCMRLSLLDSFLRVFAENAPRTLLREHYRCHPKIIQFCNKQFYNNELIPMTQDNGEDSLALIITAKGNHTRKLSNLRELDSLEVLDWDAGQSRGFIAPFRNQVALATSRLPDDFVSSTVHKFQGRECEEIVFSTVLDHKNESKKRLQFVDNPFLVNVAVSRAQKRFILVTGDEVFAPSSHIAALIRHIEYYADSNSIYKSPVISAFDILYEEYDESLRELNQQIRKNNSVYKSEKIIEYILREQLRSEVYRTIMSHKQVPLNQLISIKSFEFTQRELQFMQNRASCDFVLYFKVGKTPIGVIEVDGEHHENLKQRERDSLKESILSKVNIPLLRLRTVESHIEARIADFLKSVSGF